MEMKTHIDVKANVESRSWFYNDTVKDHFFHPKNFLKDEAAVLEFEKIANGIGQVGSPACGDMMKMWVYVNEAEDRIIDCKCQTFGCASAIGSTSMLSVIITENGVADAKDDRRKLYIKRYLYAVSKALKMGLIFTDTFTGALWIILNGHLAMI